MLKQFQIITLIYLSIQLGFSQTNYTQIEKLAREKMFELKFDETSNLLTNKKSNTANYLLAYNLFLQNILIGGEKNFSAFNKQFELSSKNIEKSKDDSLKFIYLSEINLQNSIIKLLNREFMSGGMGFIKSFGYFKDAKKKYPKSDYNLKLSALYNIIAGITPDKGKMFLKTIGLTGNIHIGVKQLRKHVTKSEKNKLYYTEAFIINKLAVSFLKEDVGTVNLPKEEFNISLNTLNIFSNIMINYKEHNYTKINTNINTLLNNNTTKLPHLQYISGIINTLNDKKKARKNLKIFLIQNKSKHFIKATYWQLARIAVLENNIDLYNTYRKKTIEKGTAFTEADKQAKAEAELNIKPNIVLLTARLLFDAGLYSQAKKHLLKKSNNTKIKTPNEYAEFFYRLARTYSKLNNNEKAKKYYKLVIKEHKISNRYFGPYSALQLGIIYENENNITKAKEFYNLALEINNGEYKNSIKHKAKSRLNKKL